MQCSLVCVVCRRTACCFVLGASCSANEVLGPRRRAPAHRPSDMIAQTKWKCVHKCNHPSNVPGRHAGSTPRSAWFLVQNGCRAIRLVCALVRSLSRNMCPVCAHSTAQPWSLQPGPYKSIEASGQEVACKSEPARRVCVQIEAAQGTAIQLVLQPTHVNGTSRAESQRQNHQPGG